MEAHQQEVAWNVLRPALMEDEGAIRQEVATGRSQLYVWGGEFYTVCRAEGSELVMVASAGKNSLKYWPEIHRRAKAQGYKTVRMHVTRPETFLKVSERYGLGYQYAETVLRSPL